MYTHGGMRVATQPHSKGFVTISGAADLHFRSVDISIGRHETNSYGQIDMSAGSFSVGELLALQEPAIDCWRLGHWCVQPQWRHGQHQPLARRW